MNFMKLSGNLGSQLLEFTGTVLNYCQDVVANVMQDKMISPENDLDNNICLFQKLYL